MKIKVYILNAFAKSTKGGNPAGVVLEANQLSNKQMQKIANKINLPETTFIQKSNKADFKLKFFTPNCEVDLCGHATIASFSLMAKLGLLKPGKYTQETKAGILDIEIKPTGVIFMNQNIPQFLKKINKQKIVDALNISMDTIVPDLPVEIVSTGLPTIIVPIVSLDKLIKIKPSLKKCIKLCKNKFLLHLLTLETGKKNQIAYSRNLFPIKTMDEEAATGTASGALACYLHNHNKINKKQIKQMIFKQGHSMGSPSKILVRLKVEKEKIIETKVGGSTSNIKQKIIEIN